MGLESFLTMEDSILITGANGFIARSLSKELKKKNKFKNVLGTTRSLQQVDNYDRVFPIGDIEKIESWKVILKDVHVVVHLAGRAHITREKFKNPLEKFRKVNRDATVKLAKECISAGVRRFIFVSSIGVLGEQKTGEVFTQDSIANPIEPYAISKYEAEVELKKLAKDNHAFELVIIRPPLVYGPDAPGNFHRLVKLISLGLPLPFGAMNNYKTMVSLDELTDFLVYCIESGQVIGLSLLIGDKKNWSTSELIQKIAILLGKSTYNIPIPVSLLKLLTMFIGMRSAIDKLNAQLVIDNHTELKKLGWNSKIDPETAMENTIKNFHF